MALRYTLPDGSTVHDSLDHPPTRRAAVIALPDQEEEHLPLTAKVIERAIARRIATEPGSIVLGGPGSTPTTMAIRGVTPAGENIEGELRVTMHLSRAGVVLTHLMAHVNVEGEEPWTFERAMADETG